MSNVSLVNGHIDDEKRITNPDEKVTDLRTETVMKIEDILRSTNLPWHLIYDPYTDRYHIMIDGK